MSWLEDYEDLEVREYAPEVADWASEKETVDEENIIVNIIDYSGHQSNYDNWTVNGRVWVEEDGERKYIQRLRLGFPKDSNVTEKQIKSKFVKQYKSFLKEESEKYSLQHVDSERQVLEKLMDEEHDKAEEKNRRVNNEDNEKDSAGGTVKLDNPEDIRTYLKENLSEGYLSEEEEKNVERFVDKYASMLSKKDTTESDKDIEKLIRNVYEGKVL